MYNEIYVLVYSTYKFKNTSIYKYKLYTFKQFFINYYHWINKLSEIQNFEECQKIVK